jgi:UDPglucose--hexose-1-phosphate uridylyltransferase
VTGRSSSRRRNQLTGQAVVVVAKRQGRPNLPSSDCPFCPGGLEAPEPYDVRWFPNRWPSFPDDRCQIVLYTSEHDATFWSLGVEGARRVVDLWAERTETLGARPDISYVLVFENRGAEVGATIPHPHGQVYAFDEVPPTPAAELAQESCPVCALPPAGGRLVVEAGGWSAETSDAPSWPFELVVAPRAHVPDLPSLDDAARDGLAAVLVDVLARLDRLFDAPMPYMLWFHQRPTDGGDWPTAHLHLHVAPFFRAPGTPRFMAGGELGSGVHFNTVGPDEAAARLRDAGS